MADSGFEQILSEVKALHDKKSADYTNGTDPHSNFRHSGEQVGISPGMACEVLIATKQARLRELLSAGKTPQNESVEDTLRDRIVYAIIALDMYRKGLYGNKIPPTLPRYESNEGYAEEVR